MLAHPPPSPLAKGCFSVTPGFHDHHFDFPPEPDRHDWSDKTNNGHLKIKTTLLVCLTFYVNELHRFLFGVKRWNGIFQYFYILKGSWGQKSKNLFSTGRDNVRGGGLKEESCASNRVRQFKWFSSANQKRAFLAVTITYGPIPSFGRRFVEDDVSAPLCDRLNRINLKKNGQGSDKKS